MKFISATTPCLALILGTLMALNTSAAHASVENFVLLDQNGEAQELFYDKEATAIVVMIHGNGCQIVRSVLPDYKALRDNYASRGVHFFLIWVSLSTM